MQVTIPEEVRDQAKQAEAALARAREVRVTSAEGYATAAEQMVAVKKAHNKLEKARKSITKPIDEAKRAVQNFFKPVLNYLKEAEGIIKKSMARYDDEQERIRREEQRRLDDEARKKEEVLRAEKEHEANAAEIMGQEGMAENLRQEAEETHVPTPIAPSAQPQVDGISRRTNWRAFVVDIGRVPREYMIPDMQKLNALARATKGPSNIPGVEFEAESTIAARA